MSQENVEIVRAAYDAHNARDMDALRELYDPDTIIVRGLDGWPEPGPFVGREDVMRGIGRGPELNMDWTVIVTLRKGKIFLMEYFWDHTEALEAVGLSE